MKLHLVGLSGSLRKGSYNTALLRAFGRALPDGVELRELDTRNVPLYDEDLDGDDAPEAATSLREAILASDAVIFATPEYNYGIPGGLKNAIDWASRPAFQSPLTHKPAGILSASKSPIGGARAQAALRNVLGGTLSPVFPHVEMLVALAHEQFDREGSLTNETTRKRLARYAEEFVEWLRGLHS